MIRKIVLSILISFLFVAPDTASAAPDIAGRWKVYTTLVSAYQAVNPQYHPGDKRLEKWTVKAKGKKATLRSQAGTIQGKRVGKAWVFDQSYDTGYGVIVHIHLVARVYPGRKLRGTTEVRYYDSRAWLGNPILGNDAWTFKGTRL